MVSKKNKKNMLCMISTILQSLNIKSLIIKALLIQEWCDMFTRSTFYRAMSNFWVRILFWHFSKDILRSWLWRLWDIGSNLWNGRAFWRELTILACSCSWVCFICVESLEKKKKPTLALENGHAPWQIIDKKKKKEVKIKTPSI